jgi:hypothetical protein
MNYDAINQIDAYYREEILPHLTQMCTVISFDDYLKRFSCLPSGKWMKDFELVKLTKCGFVVDPHKFVKKYKSHCVGFYEPMKPEAGIRRVIYQISPMLHIEMALWAWVEHDILQSYAALFIYHHSQDDCTKFIEEVYNMRRTGNTEEKPAKAGFLGIIEACDDIAK